MSEDAAQVQAQLLARLIPPLVHRLNNLLAVVSGTCDIWVRDGQAPPPERFGRQVDAMRTAVDEVLRLVRGLSSAAKVSPEAEGEADAEALLARVADLIQPFAAEQGVELALGIRGGSAVVSTDLRNLVRSLLLLLAALIALPAEERPRRLRLSVTVAAGRSAWTVVTRHPLPPDANALAGPLAALEAFVRGAGARWRRRRLGLASAWRLVLPAQSHPQASHTTFERRGRVLLVEPDPLLGELVATVLEESGLGVEVRSGLATALDEAPGFDLLLVDAGAAADPAHRERLARVEVRVLVLGSEPPPPRASLAKPFRPDDLLAAVEEQLRVPGP